MKSGQQVSRYVVLGKLARGGMAEVWLARQRGPAGFEKTLVLKTIAQPFNENPAFVEMFLSEARLAALINHPNVVQIFDLTDEPGDPFIAMEYLEGRNLAQISKLLLGNNALWDPAVAVRIIAECCAGLECAHGLKDSRGNSLNIIHRDVTPENIFVTYQGHIKLLDFGIAKAVASSSLTKPGNIRGKLMFLAPEQVMGQKLDRRVDVWALGVNLYIMLTGKNPFEASSDLEVMRGIAENTPKPPSSLRPGLPANLDAVVMRALERDPERRVATAGALRLQLEEYLSAMPPVSAFHVAAAMERLYPAMTDPVRQKLSALLSLPTEEIIRSLELQGGVVARPTPPTATVADPPPPPGDDVEMNTAEFANAFSKGFDLNTAQPQPAPDPLRPPPKEAATKETPLPFAARVPPPLEVKTPPSAEERTLFVRVAPVPEVPDLPAARRRPGLPLLAGVPAALALLIGVAWWARTPAPAARPIPPLPPVETPTPVVPVDPTPAPPPEVPPEKPVAKPPVEDPPVEQVEEPDEKPPEKPVERPVEKRPDRTPSRPTGGTLLVTSNVGANVYVDGRMVGKTPLRMGDVARGEHRVRVVYRLPEGTATKEQVVQVTPGSVTERKVTFGRGRLNVRVAPWADVRVDGRKMGVTPLKPLSLLEGEHEVVLTNSELKVRKAMRVTIEAGKDVELKVKMNE